MVLNWQAAAIAESSFDRVEIQRQMVELRRTAADMELRLAEKDAEVRNAVKIINGIGRKLSEAVKSAQQRSIVKVQLPVMSKFFYRLKKRECLFIVWAIIIIIIIIFEFEGNDNKSRYRG